MSDDFDDFESMIDEMEAADPGARARIDAMAERMELAQAVSQWRRASGVSTPALAEALGIAVHDVISWELGEQDTSPEILASLVPKLAISGDLAVRIAKATNTADDGRRDDADS